jgi:hypothetical protein
MLICNNYNKICDTETFFKKKKYNDETASLKAK